MSIFNFLYSLNDSFPQVLTIIYNLNPTDIYCQIFGFITVVHGVAPVCIQALLVLNRFHIYHVGMFWWYWSNGQNGLRSEDWIYICHFFTLAFLPRSYSYPTAFIFLCVFKTTNILKDHVSSVLIVRKQSSRSERYT